MDPATRFGRVERALQQAAVPSWHALGAELGFADDRWRRHDPANVVREMRSAWAAANHDWSAVGALWVGIETDGSSAFLDPVGYAALDESGFPRGLEWHADRLVSDDLTAFAEYRRGGGIEDDYDYWAPLAWTGMIVRLVPVAPSNVTVLAGFPGGDWLTFPGASGSARPFAPGAGRAGA